MNRVIRIVVCVSVGLMVGDVVQAEGELRFADVLTDNMVLQRGRPVKCWGWAKPGSEVEVLLTQSKDKVIDLVGEEALEREEQKRALSEQSPLIGKVRVAYTEDEPGEFVAVKKTTKADKQGRWEVALGSHAASFTPTYLAAKCGNDGIAIQNLLIGEVWIASGQSNMEWAWSRDKMWENKGLCFNGVRYAKVRGDSYTPRDSFVTEGVSRGAPFEPWIVCEDGAVDRVSSVAYLFAQYLHRRLKVPVGIINIAQGGSFSREWCERGLLERLGSPTVAAQVASHDEKVEQDDKARYGRGPCTLFNARLYPIRHMAVAGVIYLQGENEALCGDTPQYVKTFPGVIESYRVALNNPELPFGIITLQGMGNKRKPGMNSGGYPVIREIHQQVHKRTANTGYIVAHDVGGGIHPDWKRPLAERAVYWALLDVYKTIDKATRTRIKGATFEDGKAIVEFEELELKDGAWTSVKAVLPRMNDQQPYAGFRIAGADRVWHEGRIAVADGPVPALTVSHPLVEKPVAVRYAWDGYSPGNLGSWVDPVPPFRSDDWQITPPDEVSDAGSGEQSPAVKNYLSGHETRNRELEGGLGLAITESREKLIKRYAHPKGILESTVAAMSQLMRNFDPTGYEDAPDMAHHALYRIPGRYWRREPYTAARRAKWGWLIERVLRLPELPDEMEKAVAKRKVAARIAELEKALDSLQEELEKLPEPKQMAFDDMLDRILPIMQKEQEKMEAEGKWTKGELSKNPF